MWAHNPTSLSAQLCKLMYLSMLPVRVMRCRQQGPGSNH